MSSDRLTTNRFQAAFTLIEMMVVIGILSIVSYWAVPSIKKAHAALNLRRNTENLDMLYSAMRSYYLIFNEFPADCSQNNTMSKGIVWTVPSSFYTRVSDATTYNFNIKPLGNDTESYYDIDNWFEKKFDSDSSSESYAFYISIRESKEKATKSWLSFLEERYPYAPRLVKNSSTCLGYPEIPQKLTDASAHKNRFY